MLRTISAAGRSFALAGVCLLGALLWPSATPAVQRPREQRAVTLSKPRPTGEPRPSMALLGVWQDFRVRHGAWHLDADVSGRSVHRAFGRGIAVAGSVTDAATARSAALEFFRAESDLTKALSNVDLRVIASERAGRVWYVHLRQHHQGLPVLFRDVNVRLGQDGRVFAFASEIDEITLDVRPALSADQARTAARAAVDEGGSDGLASLGDRLYVLPLHASDTEAEAASHALVRRVRVSQTQPPHEWEVLVDAHDGRIRHIHDRVRYGAVQGRIQANVHPKTPMDPVTVLPMSNLELRAGSYTTLTATDGSYTLSGPTSSTTVEARLQGPHVDVNRQDGEDAVFTIPVDLSTNVALDLLFDDANSHPAERDGYYHAEIAYQWIRGLDPALTSLDYGMPCAVNIANTCNAYWNGTGINFFVAGNGCNNTATVADVVYHEYGHGINDKLYEQLGAAMGMVNAALHEGLADVTAALIEDDPIIGQGFFDDGASIRTLDNSLAYPQDLTGEPHLDGLIVGGAIWDLRQRVGVEMTRRLSHFARYGAPDDAESTRGAFADYFLEILIANDDDSDLSNGTPNDDAIFAAFNAHGIGPTVFVDIIHTEAADVTTPYASARIEAHFTSSSPLFPLDATSTNLAFTVDGGNEQTIPMAPVSGSSFGADLPGQPSGSLVAYHLQGSAKDGSPTTYPHHPDAWRFSYLVGPQQVLLIDDFESEAGWSVGASGDAALTGLWERADPEGTITRGLRVQPEDDHSAVGTRCFVTGALAGPGSGSHDVDGGATTLLSPVFDLSSAVRPAVRYHRWFSNDLGANPSGDPWRVDISNDGGLNWVPIENTTSSDNDWRKIIVQVEPLLTPTSQMRLRFVATDDDDGSLVEAAIDDVDIVHFPEATSIPGEAPRLGDVVLWPNAPNPFNPSTILRFDLPRASTVDLRIYDAAGRHVRTLAKRSYPAGTHLLRWDGRNDAGQRLASGIYLYRLRTGDFDRTRSMILLK